MCAREMRVHMRGEQRTCEKRGQSASEEKIKYRKFQK